MKRLIKYMLGYFDFLFCSAQSNELVVVNYHGITQKSFRNFKKQVEFFKHNYNVIGPNQMKFYFEGNILSNKPSLLITFDDGIANQYEAACYLQEQHIQAYFFIVPKFVLTSAEDQPSFFRRNIRPISYNSFVNDSRDSLSLTQDELLHMKTMGHSFGVHSATHTMTANSSNAHFEIVESKNQLAKILEIDEKELDSFCSIVDTSKTVGENDFKLIAENYKYHFSTFPGSNLSRNKHLIHRCNVESNFYKGELYFSLGCINKKWWKARVVNFSKKVR